MEELQLKRRIQELTYQISIAVEDLEEMQHAVLHDLRSPLRAVRGFCKILQEDYGEKLDEGANRLVHTIVQNSEKVNHLIDNLIHYSQVGQKSVSMNEVNMNRLVEECLGELLSGEEKEGLNLQISDLLPCWGDASLLKEVWIQLLKNALLFTSRKEEASINISSTGDESSFIYAIKDTGAGFDMEYSNNMFKLFQRLHSQAEFEGTGTGLAIVKRIILKHKGSLWAEGVTQQGSTFYFSIPKLN